MKPGLVDVGLGIGINEVEQLRKLADYTGDPVSGADAACSSDFNVYPEVRNER